MQYVYEQTVSNDKIWFYSTYLLFKEGYLEKSSEMNKTK